MKKRTHTRIPVSVEVMLINHNEPPIKARAINISMGGIGVTDLSRPLERAEYDIQLMPSLGYPVVWLNAKLVYQEDSNAGFNRNIAEKINLGHLVQAYS